MKELGIQTSGHGHWKIFNAQSVQIGQTVFNRDVFFDIFFDVYLKKN